MMATVSQSQSLLADRQNGEANLAQSARHAASELAQRESCGDDASLGQRCRVAHMPTAATTTTTTKTNSSSRRLLEKARRRFRYKLSYTLLRWPKRKRTIHIESVGLGRLLEPRPCVRVRRSQPTACMATGL
jgi:hypothetical protein